MIKIRFPVVVAAFALIISACNTSSSTSVPSPSDTPSALQPIETPTLIPDTATPEPAAIDAPVVESPSLVDIHFLNEKDGWGVTETQVVRTDDGGVTWYNVTPPEVTETGFSVRNYALNVERFWMQIPDFTNYPNSGVLYRTSDGGMTWAKFATPFSGGDIQFLDENNGWVLADLGVGAGSNAVAIFQTTDGGATWNKTYTNDPNQPDAGDSLPLGGLKSGIVPLNMQTAWVSGVVYSDGTVYLYRTDDGGANWSQVTTLALPPEAQNLQISFQPVQFVSAQTAYVTALIPSDAPQMAVYISNDAGNTWTLTPTLIPNGGSADFLSATDAVMYNGEQFYITHDAAQTWSKITPDVTFGDTFARMDFVNPSTGWITTQDADNHRILYQTTDGGATWSPLFP